MFELKRLSTAAIPAALAKAERYRLLNEPEEAQSICEDVLTADPDNFEAVRTLILALTDSFPNHDPNNVSRAQELVARLPSEYERAYFGGLVAERRARALLSAAAPAAPCRRAICCAKPCMRSSAPRRSSPPTMTTRLLRWNACARLFERHPELAEIDEERTAPVMLE